MMASRFVENINTQTFLKLYKANNPLTGNEHNLPSALAVGWK